MYQFANLLLGMLLLAAAGALIHLAARSRGDFSQIISGFLRLWREPNFLFGPAGSSALLRCGQGLFLAALGLYAAETVLGSSLLAEKWPLMSAFFDGVLDPLIFVCLAAKILFCTRYTWRQLAAAGSAYFIFRWVFFNSQDIWLIFFIWFALAAKDVDLGRAVRVYAVAMGAAVLLVILLSLVGYLENIYWEDPWRHRWYFGFSHPNTLGGFLMALVCSWVFLRAKNWRWVDFVPLLAMELFNDFGPYVRTLQVILRGMLAVFLLVKLLPRRTFRPRWVRAVLALGPMWMFALSLLLVYWFDHHFDPIIDYANICLTGRIYLQSSGFSTYAIPIAGQVLRPWPDQDNCFIAALFKYGPVLSALIWGCVCVILWQLLQKGRIYTAVLLECMLCYAYFEILFFHLTGNPLLLLFCAPLFLADASEYLIPEPLHEWADR